MPESHSRAIDFNKSARRAYETGDYNKATRLYQVALRRSRSIEDQDKIASNLISLAVVYRKTGDSEKAYISVNEIIESRLFPFSHNRMSEAVFIRAMLTMDKGRYADASKDADTSLHLCKQGDCKAEGRIYNLKARLSLLTGELGQAVSHAKTGLKHNKKFGDREEEANSVRLMAEAMKALGKHEEARGFYEEALDMDKQLGVSGKIAVDLVGIGDTYMDKSEMDKACNYYMRGLTVNENRGSGEVALDVAARAERCVKQLNGN